LHEWFSIYDEIDGYGGLYLQSVANNPIRFGLKKASASERGGVRLSLGNAGGIGIDGAGDIYLLEPETGGAGHPGGMTPGSGLTRSGYAISVSFGYGSGQAVQGSDTSQTPASGKVPRPPDGETALDPEWIEDADETQPGKVSTGTQRYAGEKTFEDGGVFDTKLRIPTGGSHPSSPDTGQFWHLEGGSFYGSEDAATRRFVTVPDDPYTHGQLFFIGSDGKPHLLDPATSGYILTTFGGGSDPAWAAAGAPSAHHTSHEAGGGDAIQLDDLALPDDNTGPDTRAVSKLRAAGACPWAWTIGHLYAS